MKLEIEISEENIARLVEEMIAKEFLLQKGSTFRKAQSGIRDGMDKAVKNYIYSEKDAIIERVIDRATREVVKKGLPKFLEDMGKKV